MAEFQETLEAWRQTVETALQERFADAADYKRLYESMRYSLLAGGKRIRPVLCMAFCQAVGGRPETALPAAVAMEMVHTYSLIHDDLPCMDNDDYRRGRLTNHKVYGEAVATLAGDGLLTQAFYELAKLEIPPERVVRCVAILSRAAGPDGMVGGQILDLEGESRLLSETELSRMCALKTGALLAAACQMGAVIGGGDQQAVEAAGAFGLHLGLAFQIRDDMLDEIGTQQELGKPIGSDAENGKSTYVRLLGLEECQERARKETASALNALSGGGFGDTEFLEDLTILLLSRMK